MRYIVTVLLFLSLFSCSKNVSRANREYRVYYIYNGGSCESCLQGKYIAKAVAKKLNTLVGSGSLETVRTDRDEKGDMIEECQLFTNFIMVAEYQGDSIVNYEKFDANESVMYPNNPQIIVDKAYDRFIKFVNTGKHRWK